MTPKRPINADVPPPEGKDGSPGAETTAEPPRTAPAPQKDNPPKTEESPQKDGPPTKDGPPMKDGPPGKDERAPRQRKPRSGAPKLLIALVALALVFIVAAIVGSGGKDEGGGEVTPSAPAGGGGTGTASEGAEAPSFPAFATSNTTRIGGSSPTSNAAGVALVVFPSATEEQRPAAVTLVGEEDWAGAIAAAVLMSPPIRSPLLFSAPDELPEDSEEALAALAPQGSEATGGASLFAIGAVALPDGPGKVTRVDSGDPAATAAQIATLRDRLAGRPPTHLLVASSSSPDFAMPAAAWAARSGDPVLYAEAKKLPAATAAALRAHPKVPVYVLGPPSAISAKVFKEIGKLAARVKRVAGRTPSANALALARFHDGSFGWNVNDPGHGFVLARSDSPADAAAAAPLSASGTWGPLLLTEDAGRLPDDLRSYFLDVKPGYTTDPTRAFYNRVWLVGDQEAIDVPQQAEVNELAELAKIGGGP